MIDRNTEPPMTQNPCYLLVRFNSTELELELKRFFFSFLCSGKY